MTNEFNLSEKITDQTDPRIGSCIVTEDVKEFIRLLKEELNSKKVEIKANSRAGKTWNNIIELHLNTIDKLAGEKLCQK
jgi:hypothetical protein